MTPHSPQHWFLLPKGGEPTPNETGGHTNTAQQCNPIPVLTFKPVK